MVEQEHSELLVEVAGKPPLSRIDQEINLAWWDKFIEDIGEQMKIDKTKIHNPKISYWDLKAINKSTKKG